MKLIPRKWEYITLKLEEIDAPKKVINAAKNIDDEVVRLGLGYNTSQWRQHYEKHVKTKKVLTNSKTFLYDLCLCTDCCTACKECVECKNCLLGNNKGCTPRNKYPDNYYMIVKNWLGNE